MRGATSAVQIRVLSMQRAYSIRCGAMEERLRFASAIDAPHGGATEGWMKNNMIETNRYRIEYSELKNGKRVTHSDMFFDETMKGALKQCRRCYGSDTYRVERVYKEVPAKWIQMDLDYLES